MQIGSAFLPGLYAFLVVFWLSVLHMLVRRAQNIGDNSLGASELCVILTVTERSAQAVRRGSFADPGALRGVKSPSIRAA